MEFEVRDFIDVVLNKDHFPIREYNKLAARKIGPLEILERINSDTYRLNLPSVDTPILTRKKTLEHSQ